MVPLEDLSTIATSGSYNDLLNKPSIPTKTSDLTNDSHFAVDANYVHTDNNFSNALKSNYDTAYTNNHTHANATALNNLSGVNTGDQDLSGLVTKTTTINGHALSANDYCNRNRCRSANNFKRERRAIINTRKSR